MIMPIKDYSMNESIYAYLERRCPICNSLLRQKDGEKLYQFKNRKTCGVSCAGIAGGRAKARKVYGRTVHNTKLLLKKCYICHEPLAKDNVCTACLTAAKVKGIKETVYYRYVVQNWGESVLSVRMAADIMKAQKEGRLEPEAAEAMQVKTGQYTCEVCGLSSWTMQEARECCEVLISFWAEKEKEAVMEVSVGDQVVIHGQYHHVVDVWLVGGKTRFFAQDKWGGEREYGMDNVDHHEPEQRLEGGGK